MAIGLVGVDFGLESQISDQQTVDHVSPECDYRKKKKKDDTKFCYQLSIAMTKFGIIFFYSDNKRSSET